MYPHIVNIVVVDLYSFIPKKEATFIVIDLLTNDSKEVTKRTKVLINEIKTLLNLCLPNLYILWEVKYINSITLVLKSSMNDCKFGLSLQHPPRGNNN